LRWGRTGVFVVEDCERFEGVTVNVDDVRDFVAAVARESCRAAF